MAESDSNPAWPDSYYAVVFTSKRRTGDDGYGAMADEMDRLARQQPGFLGAESVRGSDGLGITVAYWKDEASIANWKANGRHLLAQKLGRDRWYEYYDVRVAKVERSYHWQINSEIKV